MPGSSIEIVTECWAPYISGGLCRMPPPTVATPLLVTTSVKSQILHIQINFHLTRLSHLASIVKDRIFIICKDKFQATSQIIQILLLFVWSKAGKKH